MELRPLVRALSLRRRRLGGALVHSARSGDVEWIAATTGIGTRAAAAAAERLLESVAADHLVVVGIAGGVAPHAKLGDLIVPELVLDGASGREHRPAPLGDDSPRGVLRTSDELLTQPARLARLAAEGIAALDMETAAIAAVCERRGCPWSVFRAISDMAGETPAELLSLAGPDGTGSLGSLLRYLAPAPWRALRLAQLARDSARAARIAAEAAARACALERARAEGAGTPAPR